MDAELNAAAWKAAELHHRITERRQSCLRWLLSTFAVALILWVWVRAPGLDVGTALENAAKSFEPNRLVEFITTVLIDNFNVGYAILFGPVILSTLLLLLYIRAERFRAAFVDSKYASGHGLEDLTVHGAQAVWVTFQLLVVVGAQIALYVRYFDFRREVDSPAAGSKLWEFPWSGAEHAHTWFNPFRRIAWYGFKAVLPDSTLESRVVWHGGVIAESPYRHFPYIYPGWQVWIDITLLIGVVYLTAWVFVMLLYPERTVALRERMLVLRRRRRRIR